MEACISSGTHIFRPKFIWLKENSIEDNHEEEASTDGVEELPAEVHHVTTKWQQISDFTLYVKLEFYN